MSLKQTNIADAISVVSLEEAKRQVYKPGDNDSDFEALLTGLIQTVVQACQDYTWRQLPAATSEYRLDAFPDGILELPRPPVTAITSVEYVNANGTQTLATANYRTDLNSEPARLEPVTNWPATKEQMDAVIITYTNGFDGDTQTIPDPLKQGMLMLIKYLYENRDAVAVSHMNSMDVKELPFGVKWMWDPYSLRNFG